MLKKEIKTNKYDIIIAVDKGLESLNKIRIKPTYIIGDFDSIKKRILKKYEKTNINIKRLKPEKDFTDTHSAIRQAMELKSSKITIIGATRNKNRPYNSKYTHIKRSSRK